MNPNRIISQQAEGKSKAKECCLLVQLDSLWVLNQEPSDVHGWNVHEHVDIVVMIQSVEDWLSFLLLDKCSVGETGVVKRQRQILCDMKRSRIKDHGESALSQCWIDVHKAVDILHIRTTNVNDVTDEDLTISLVKGDPFCNHCLGEIRVVQLIPAIAGGYSSTQVLRKSPLVCLQVFGQGFELSGSSSSMVVDQRNEHPALSWNVMERIVVHALARHHDILPARQAVLILVVSHAGLGAALVEITVRLIDEHIAGAHGRVELRLNLRLPVDGVTKIVVVRMIGGVALITSIGTVSLQHA
eukprot:m.613556 g.613556  ORF g.613556 m.613556 type:complete len:300 (-) comp58148_c0_seq7:1102-2001(-)